MNFDFSDEQKLLQRTAREYLAEHSPLAACRAALEGKPSHGTDLWRGAAELGWLGAAIPESYGGAGFGPLELALLATEVGRALAPIPFGSSVVLATEALLLAGSEAQRARYLPELASGAAIGCWAVDERDGKLGTVLENGRLRGEKRPVADGAGAHLAIVSARGTRGVTLALVSLGHASVSREKLDSLDPSRPLAALRFSDTPAEILGVEGDGEKWIEKITSRAAVLFAFEQLGVAERALEITREYDLERYAFGRPIASFQAIKHRLADLYSEIELARSNSYYGAWALAQDHAELPVAACVSRVSATTAAELAAKEMIQLHGGLGYTWEADCHLFYRRAKWLGLALGPVSQWRERLARLLWGTAA